MKRAAQWSPVSLAIGVWMLWCVAAVSISMIGRSFAESRESFSVPLVAVFLAAGLLAVVGGANPRAWIGVALSVSAAAIALATVVAFGGRGVVGAVGVGLALAAGPVGAAWGTLRQQRDWPESSPDRSASQLARLGCAVIGAGIVVLFGTPVVHAWLRGVAPYDLGGLTPSTLVERFPETVPVLLFALGLVALAATVAANRYGPVVAATILTLLVAVAVVQLDASTPLLTAVRLVVVVGGSVVVTALIGVAVLGRPRAAAAGHG